MKTTLILLILFGLALWPAAALAACTTTTIIADGQVRLCTVCTFGGQTTVTCL